MATSMDAPSSRRALLTASAAAVAGLLAQALGRPLTAHAADGDTLKAGRTKSASSTTGVKTTVGHGFKGESSDSDSDSAALYADNTGAGRGLEAHATSLAVWAEASTGIGLYATSEGRAMYAASYGTSGTGPHDSLFAQSVLGGIVSTSAEGTAVSGSSGGPDARGVKGEVTGGGYGVYGSAIDDESVGGYFESLQGGGAGTALQAVGHVKFSTAGNTSFAVGDKSKTVDPGTDLKSASVVLCTLDSDQGGLSIDRIKKDTSADTFTVHLSAQLSSGKYAKVGWFVIG